MIRSRHPENIGREVAAALGYTGRIGGWLYAPDGRAVCHGYVALAALYGYEVDRDAPTLAYRLTADGQARLDREIASRGLTNAVRPG